MVAVVGEEEKREGEEEKIEGVEDAEDKQIKKEGLSLLPVTHSILYLPTTPPIFAYDKKQRLSPTLIVIPSPLARFYNY
ncbi:hypothetical protein N7527_000931 [Penicillium freii]|nr:hypothetical protein N7527_000931 [Penicillium freii]